MSYIFVFSIFLYNKLQSTSRARVFADSHLYQFCGTTSSGGVLQFIMQPKWKNAWKHKYGHMFFKEKEKQKSIHVQEKMKENPDASLSDAHLSFLRRATRAFRLVRNYPDGICADETLYVQPRY